MVAHSEFIIKIEHRNTILNAISVFSTSTYPIKLLRMLNDQTGSGKSKMAVTKTGYDYISACKQDGSEILTAISMFSGSSYTMISTGMLHEETGSGKSNMAACKQEVHISQLVDVIETKFQQFTQRMCK